MAHGTLSISITDLDLVTGAFRSLLALHQEDNEGECLDCFAVYPCATVRIIAASQDAALERVANLDGFMDNKPRRRHDDVVQDKGHHFKYPECPEFSGGICDQHHGRPLSDAA